jgi:hypothetical protein
MNRYLSLVMLVVAMFLVGCNEQIGDYIAASSISRNGFARDGKEMRKVHGQEVKIWGFVDHSNMYGDAGAKEILEDWWSGEGPSTTTWRFNLKARENDDAGHSFAVHVPNDQGRLTPLSRPRNREIKVIDITCRSLLIQFIWTSAGVRYARL